MRQMIAGMVIWARWLCVGRLAILVLSRGARYLTGTVLCALALGAQANKPPDAKPRTAQQWMERMQEASRNCIGMVVELHASGAMAVSRIWHAVRDGHPFERIDSLDGVARTVYRHDGVVRIAWHG